ncbi:hypothetical protein N431DRAFT_461083 [Stipitochalara longipes BDJ]|nr:hypothetical protein N431DRAFT_461083 [Stipitochalara longipes BDJ]
MAAALLTAPIEGYAVVEMQWIGEYQGHAYNLSGTVEKVITHLQTIDPTLEFPARDRSRLAARYNGGYLCCHVAGQSFRAANGGEIEAGIDYLNALNTNLYLDPLTCSRISCSYEAAIWWCNQLPNYQFDQGSVWLGQHAETLVDNCWDEGDVNFPTLCGQDFDPGGYNIIVRYDATNGC